MAEDKTKKADSKGSGNESKGQNKNQEPQTQIKPETTGSIPGKTETHPPVIAGEPSELGRDSVPGDNPDQPGHGFGVIAGKSEDHPQVMAGQPAELGKDSVPGGNQKDFRVIPGKSEDHPPVIAGSNPALGTDSVPSVPTNEPVDADVDDEDAPKKTVKMRFVGYKGRSAARIPSAVTMIMPDKRGQEQEKAKQAVTSGRTLVVKRDEYREFTSKEAEWLNKHSAYEFEKA